MSTKGYSTGLFMDCKLQTDKPKKGWAKFLSAQIVVTLGRFCHCGSANILGQQKFGLFHIEIKFVFKYISSFRFS